MAILMAGSSRTCNPKGGNSGRGRQSGDSGCQRQWDRAKQMKSRTCDFSSALGHILKYVRLAFTITFTHIHIHRDQNKHAYTLTPTPTPTGTHIHINGGMMRQLSLRVCCRRISPLTTKGYKWLRPLFSVSAFRVFGFYFWFLCAGVRIYIFVSISMTANNICT